MTYAMRFLLVAAAVDFGSTAALAQQPANPNPTQSEMARNQQGPIVNGQRRQPTARNLSDRQSATPNADAEAARRRDAELDDIFKKLTDQTKR